MATLFSLSKVCLFVFAVMLLSLRPAFGQDTVVCDTVIQIAESEFFNARFNQAAAILESCLETGGIPPDSLFEAHLLRARIYYKVNEESKAAEAIEEMLLLRPDYQPEPPLTPPFIAFVEYQSEVFQDKDVLDLHLGQPPPSPKFKISRRSWLMIGGGALVTGAAVAILTGGDGSDGPRFPAPPAPPLP